MRRKKNYTGINIQYPISRLILDGKKVVETRTYPIPREYAGKEMLLVETPGPNGKFKARVTAIVTFGESFRYTNSKEFYSDFEKHQVAPGSPWEFDQKKGKWGWPILKIKPLKEPRELEQRKGIRYTKNIEL